MEKPVKTYELMEATKNMLEEVNDIYLKCRERLFQQGIFQWDDQYPNKEYFQICIENKEFEQQRNSRTCGA
jgi:hypothetical protein